MFLSKKFLAYPKKDLMLKVLKAGLYTSIQDLGRKNYLKYGVPISGVMDQYAATKANLLLNNKQNCAVIECTQNGPDLLFKQPTQIAISGADMSAKINKLAITLNSSINIKAGDILNFGKLIYGYRTYIAVLPLIKNIFLIKLLRFTRVQNLNF